jgi:hypothetical protein
MYYDTPGLRDVVVLKPQWLLDVMRSILCLRNLGRLINAAEDVPRRKALRQLRDAGRLGVELALPALWRDADVRPQEEGAVLQYMIHFHLCCRLPQVENALP